MSRLAEALAAEATRTPYKRCTTGLLLEQLPLDERADLQDYIAGPTTAAAICRGLAKLGHRVSDANLTAHRRGDCACARP